MRTLAEVMPEYARTAYVSRMFAVQADEALADADALAVTLGDAVVLGVDVGIDDADGLDVVDDDADGEGDSLAEMETEAEGEALTETDADTDAQALTRPSTTAGVPPKVTAPVCAKTRPWTTRPLAKLAEVFAMMVPKMAGGDAPVMEKALLASQKMFFACTPPASEMERIPSSVMNDEETM